MEGRTPYEAIYGHTPNISSLCEFDFYEPIWYYEHNAFPEDKRVMGRWLGEAHKIGQALYYWVLPSTGVPIARSTVQPIAESEKSNEQVQAELVALEKAIKEMLIHGEISNDLDVPDYLHYEDSDEEDEHITLQFEPVDKDAVTPEADIYSHEDYDKYIASEVLLPQGDTMVLGKVVSRKRDADGNPIGVASNNPIFGTRLHQVQFRTGHVEVFSANVIAQNIYSQLDSEGHRHLMLEAIIDYRKDENAVPMEERFVVANNGNIHNRRITQGWHLCVQWVDGSTSWEPLKDLKESFPLQVAEFAYTYRLQDEAAFTRWVKDTIAKHNRIIKATKTRYTCKTHKYGIRLPRSTAEAYQIDKETGTDFWHHAIVKEMTNNASAFKSLDETKSVPIGSTWIPCHMVLDVKVDLTRKACFVACTDPPSQITFSTVISRDSVRIAFLISALNNIDILSTDIGNAYLNAETKEKVHTAAGPEFGPHCVGQTVIIVRALSCCNKAEWY
jgi:plasmid maintenance system killer protein